MLASAVQDARHTPQLITWEDEDGNAIDGTDSTLSGYIIQNNVIRPIDGELTWVTPDAGVFMWRYGTNDVGAHGRLGVQFIATYPDETEEKTLLMKWQVHPALDVA